MKTPKTLCAGLAAALLAALCLPLSGCDLIPQSTDWAAVLPGKWHADNVVGSGYDARWLFGEDGTFIYAASGYDTLGRVPYEAGTWTLEGSRLRLTITTRIELVGGEIIEDEDGEKALVDAEELVVELDPPETKTLALGDYGVDPDSERACLTIGGVTYYDYSNQPGMFDYYYELMGLPLEEDWEKFSLIENRRNELNPGDTAIILVDETPSTGYLWSCEPPENGVVELVSDMFLQNNPDNDLPGGDGGMRRFAFRAIRPGGTVIRLELRRGDDVDEARAYPVVVTGGEDAPIAYEVTKSIHEGLPAYTFTLHGFTETDDDGVPETARIYAIEIKGEAFGQWLGGFETELAIPAEGLPEGEEYGFEFDDYNNDGFLDLRLFMSSNHRRRNVSLFWLWDSGEGRYVRNEQLEDLSQAEGFDKDEDSGRMYQFFGGVGYEECYYEYIDGAFVLVERHVVRYEEDGGERYENTELYQLIGGEMKLVSKTREKE
ncbi:MAG: protease inhibitor I42 family protein [Oscillospiraceae bacterium]|nr:protease inhibitor I42 family protein [Oscillospiraceae bacterium]